jgi:hypothetical protein
VSTNDLGDVRWYADESVLGLGKLLERERHDVVYPGHRLVPSLPTGTLDIDWMPRVAVSGWVALLRDRRIRTRPAELKIFHEAGLRAVWFGGRKDLRPVEQLELLSRHWARLEREVIRLGAGPWALALTGGGLAELRMRIGKA